VAGESWKTKNKTNTENFTAKNTFSECSSHTAPFGPLFFSFLFLNPWFTSFVPHTHTHTDFVQFPSQINCSFLSSSFLIQLQKLKGEKQRR
jgi:hypothetical protein